jgi:hypothetical protein
MKKAIATAVLLLALAAPSFAGTVTITGKLVDRQCSVEDVFQLQPAAEKRCTLTFREVICGGSAALCVHDITVYCPNKAADGRLHNGAYWTCSDDSAMQINHSSANYTVTGWTRTVEQQKDGFGQVQGYQFSY